MDASDPQADFVQSKPAASLVNEVEELQEQQRSLQALFVVALAAMVVLCLGVDLYLFKQWRMAKAQLAEQGRVVSNIAAEFHQSREKNFRSFINQLETFAKANRDFLPILEKYRPALNQYFTSPPPLAVPAPVPLPKPPPQ
jgi:uncharacterized protein HemX